MVRILMLTGDNCTPDTEYAWHRMREEGLDLTIAAVARKHIRPVFHSPEEGWDTYIERPWYSMHSDASLAEIDPSQFDALLIPGGRPPESLRNMEQCRNIVRHFVDSDKPVAAIDRGPLVLLEAGVTGRRLAGASLIKPRVDKGGCAYVEGGNEAVVDGNIVTVSGRPYYHVWIRAFLSLLDRRGIVATRKVAPAPADPAGKRPGDPVRILMIITEGSSTGHVDHGYFRMLEAGCSITIAAPAKRPVRTVIRHIPPVGDWDTSQETPGLVWQPDASLDEIDPSAYAALIVPGGRGPESLRLHQRCIDVVRHFITGDKPVASICQGPQVIAEALAAAGIKGKRLSGLDAVKADVTAAGCVYLKTPGRAVVDGNIVTAWRRPDLDVWMGGFVSMLRDRGIVT